MRSLVRAGGLSLRMSPGGLGPAAAACLFPGFEGTTVPDWLRRWLADGLGGVVLLRMTDKQFYWWTRRIVFCVGVLYVAIALKRTLVG